MKRFLEWWEDKDGGDLVLYGAVLFVVILFVFAFFGSILEQRDFMSYCQAKGKTAEDCRWERKAMSSGRGSSTILFMK